MKKILYTLALLVSFSSFGQDKFTAWRGKLRVTENNVWIYSFHPENNLKDLAAKLKNNPNLTPSASIAFDNKNDAEAFVNDYIDCVINLKTIKKEEYTISSNKNFNKITNKKGQYYSFKLSMFYKKTFEVLRESLKFME
tara:strand:+ start:248 stop:664 length:417 start_codon:yes stop_codon:yes gene_type:complete